MKIIILRMCMPIETPPGPIVRPSSALVKEIGSELNP